MPCVIQKINKTHHLPLDLCSQIDFKRHRNMNNDNNIQCDQLNVDLNNVAIVTQHPSKKFRTLFVSRAWATCDLICKFSPDG